jgi:hypothetical protein
MKMRLAAVALGAVVASGCVVEVTYNPFGSDWAMEGEWTVNGLPPSTATCGNIDRVQVLLWDAGSSFTYDQLTFPCSQGSFETGQIFAYGSYDTQWQALDASGAVIGTGPREELDVFSPTPTAILAPVDFTTDVTPPAYDPFGSDFAMDGRWTINGGDATAESCGAITDIQVILYHEDTAYDYAQLTFPCPGGSFATDQIFAHGSYETQWRAIDIDGNIIGQGDRETLVVGAGITLATLRPIDFLITDPGGALNVNLDWEDKDGVLADCSIGVTTMSYQLTDSFGTVVGGETDVACGTGINWEFLPFDTYSLYVEGAMSTGAKDWMADCIDITHVTDGNAFDCTVLYVGP